MNEPRCEFCPSESPEVRTNVDLRWICDECYYFSCPPECENTERSNCPRCHEIDGSGCPHGLLCFDCRNELEQELHDNPCEICGERMGWEEVEMFVGHSGPWSIPCCHRDCAERDVH